MLNLNMPCRKCKNTLTIKDGHSDGSCHLAGLWLVCSNCLEKYSPQDVDEFNSTPTAETMEELRKKLEGE